MYTRVGGMNRKYHKKNYIMNSSSILIVLIDIDWNIFSINYSGSMLLRRRACNDYGGKKFLLRVVAKDFSVSLPTLINHLFRKFFLSK